MGIPAIFVGESRRLMVQATTHACTLLSKPHGHTDFKEHHGCDGTCAQVEETVRVSDLCLPLNVALNCPEMISLTWIAFIITFSGLFQYVLTRLSPKTYTDSNSDHVALQIQTKCERKRRNLRSQTNIYIFYTNYTLRIDTGEFYFILYMKMWEKKQETIF